MNVKNALGVLLVITVSSAVFAEGLENRYDSNRAYENTKSKCVDEGIAYRPQSENLKEAAGTFGFAAEFEISSCAVQAKINVTKDQMITILGFGIKPDNSKEIHYRIDNFKNGVGTTSDDCHVKIKTVRTGKPNWDSSETIVSNPLCITSQMR